MSSYYTVESFKAKASIGYLVRRARNLLTMHADAALAPYALTFMHWVVLMHLRDDPAQTAADIARETCHDSGALTRVIEQLAQRGLIERSRCAADRRVVTMRLSETGQALVAKLAPYVVDLLNAALAGFTHQEVDTLTSLLTRLTNDNASVPGMRHQLAPADAPA